MIRWAHFFSAGTGARRVVGPAAVLLVTLVLSSLVVVSWAHDRTAAAGTSKPPATVAAKPRSAPTTGPYHPGAIVGSSKLGLRIFVNAKIGFALATVSGASYPAATADAGKIWRINGPRFHVSAADAPNVVTQLGATGRPTYFAYGGPGGGNSINVTTDRGKRWWYAYMPGVPLAVVAHRRALIAIVEPGPGQLWAYVSTDGGRHWRHGNAFL